MLSPVSSRGGPLSLDIGGRRGSFEFVHAGLSGGGADVRRDGNTLVGVIGGREVRLQLWPGRVEGMLAGKPVSVRVQREVSALQIRGTLGDEAINLAVSPMRIAGKLGGCEYAMTGIGMDQKGWRFCERHRGSLKVAMKLPVNLTEERDDVTASVILMALVPGVLELTLEPLPPAVSARRARGR